jgi:hypothetical protein
LKNLEDFGAISPQVKCLKNLPVLFSIAAAEASNAAKQLGYLDAPEAITGDQRQWSFRSLKRIVPKRTSPRTPI